MLFQTIRALIAPNPGRFWPTAEGGGDLGVGEPYKCCCVLLTPCILRLFQPARPTRVWWLQKQKPGFPGLMAHAEFSMTNSALEELTGNVSGQSVPWVADYDDRIY